MSQIQTDFLTQANLLLVNVINSGSTAILHVKSQSDSKNYIIKAFQSDNTNTLYTREKQIHASLSHPNIITCIPDDYLFSSSQPVHYNFILMEHAPYGDFFNLILDYSLTDEKLIRTYFHHLIEGLKYLHSQRIAPPRPQTREPLASRRLLPQDSRF